jgi:uncharacterized protein YcaQ
LPILYGDRLVGKLDAAADRKGGLLRADAIHQDARFGKTTSAAVREEIRDLARWLELDVKLPAQAAARTAYQQGVSGHPAFRTCPGRIEDHSFLPGQG